MGIEGNVPKKFDRMLDPLFKYYFTRPGNEDLLLSLINGLLSADSGMSKSPLAKGVEPVKTKFKSVKLLSMESSPAFDGGKSVRLEVQARAEDDSDVYVEIQNCKLSYISNRSMICSSRMVTKYNNDEDLNKGIRRPILSVWLLDGDLKLPVKSDKVLQAVNLADIRTREIISTLSTTFYVQMPKNNQRDYHDLRLKGILTLEAEAWLRFLLSDGPDDGWDAMDEMSPVIAGKLRQLELEFWNDKAQCCAYDDAKENENMWKMTHDYAYDEGLKEGMKKGMEKGDEEGAERITFEVVQRMIGKDLSDDFILEMANITPKQLQEYKNEYKLDHPEA